MHLSVEIVPRNKETLMNSLNLLKDSFPSVNMVNIPDVLRFPIRSWEGCGLSRSFFKHRIPHIRSIDFSLDNLDILLSYLEKNDIDKILIVSGDIHTTSNKINNTTPIQLTKALLSSKPNLKIYAALDQYRSSLNEELEYAQEKIEAGVLGFFTQPFFDLDSFLLYKEKLLNVDFFLGISPVVGEKSKQYWEKVNNVVFPKNFLPTMQWNKDLGRKALNFVKSENLNIYFMPIKIDYVDYFTEVFR